MTLHLSQIFFTDARTFITTTPQSLDSQTRRSQQDTPISTRLLKRLVAFWRHTGTLLVSVNNAAAVQIVRTQLHRNTISRENADEILPHTSGYGDQHLMLILEFHFEHRVWYRLEHRGHNFYCVFRPQAISLAPPHSARQTTLAKPPATYVPTPMIPDFAV